MTDINLDTLRRAVHEGRIEWRMHVVRMLAERGITRADVTGVLLNGERVRVYDDDRPFPSALFLGYVASRPLHVVASCDEAHRRVFIITAYEPSLDVFESDYKTRRRT